jgi:phosphatidylglycerol---prolipoprotein diacylglyceryl transferase
MISYIIWNGSPEIFSIGVFSLRYYGLFFALGFLISQQILYYIHKQEGKPEKDVDTLTVYMIIATIIGARLGHVLFYEPSTLWENPLSVFLPVQFSPFRFTGFSGLASHGGAIGILFALWLYSRKKKPGQNYLQVLDRIVILVCLTAALIRTGNYFNSEIIGKPSNSPLSVVFINPIIGDITKEKEKTQLESLVIKKDTEQKESESGRVPINLYLFFKSGTSEIQATQFVESRVKNSFSSQHEPINAEPAIDYQISVEPSGTYMAKVKATGISRHPSQLYEAISCLILFGLLFWYWSKHKLNLPEGRIFGVFLIVLWGLRFGYEFLKENQVAFENDLTLNMGQNLSIPLILVGIFVLVRSFRSKKVN